MSHWFANPLVLTLFGILPFLSSCLLWAWLRRRQALGRFGVMTTLETVLTVRRAPRWLRGICWFCALLCLIVGVAGPQWGREWKQATAPGRDLIVVLDCSRSMLAETPSRFERARDFAVDLSESIQKRGGHRLGLVIFAGQARLVCPLTHDYAYFRETLNDLDPETYDLDLAPGPSDESGTRIGRALSLAVQAHDERSRGARDIMLLSDGDDPLRDGEWKQGAAEARAEGIPVLVVGIGDPNTANTIPVGDGVLRDDSGKEVRTRLEEAALREIAQLAQGVYVPAQTQRVAAGPIYLDAIVSLPVHEAADDALPGYTPRYAWFYLPALALLALAIAIPDRLPRLRLKQMLSVLRRPIVEEAMKKTLQPASVVLALGALCLLGAGTISDPQSLLKAGDDAVTRGDYATAVELYKKAELRTTEPGEVAFRLAVAKYHLAASPDSGELTEAEELFRCCLARDDKNRAAALFGLGNCLLQKAKGRNLDMVRSAIEAYELSLREAAISEPLASDVKYNVERAKLLALQLSTPPAPKDPNNPPPGNEDNPKNPPPENDHHKNPPETRNQSGTSKANKTGRPMPVKPEPGQTPIQTEEQPAPGVGKLQPILDLSEPTPVPPKDAVTHLEQATQRVLEEREAYRRQKVRPNVSGVRDW